MLTQQISNSVLTIGCEYRPPKENVMQILETCFSEILANI